jgi:predicted metal-binding membrane protein
MMVAMMLPSLVPAMSAYRRAVDGPAARRGALAALVAVGYFSAWTVVGAVAYPLGAALASAEMRWPALSRSVPLATGAVVLLAGLFQRSRWKLRQLACCRHVQRLAAEYAPEVGAAWRTGVAHGVRCCLCCAGFTAVLLVSGVMDLRVMALVAGAIAAERLSAWPERVARAVGALVMAAGVVAIARALHGSVG